MKPYSTAASVLLGVVALAHAYRLIRPMEITIAGQAIPQWVSVVALVVTGGLSIMLWRESRT